MGGLLDKQKQQFEAFLQKTEQGKKREVRWVLLIEPLESAKLSAAVHIHLMPVFDKNIGKILFDSETRQRYGERTNSFGKLMLVNM